MTCGGFQNKIKTMGFASIIMGVCTFALGVVPNFWIYLAFMALFGVAMPVLNTPATVLLQEKVEEEYLGRVFGVMGMISTSMMPLGMLIFGPIADFIKIEWMLIGTGIFIIVLAIILGRNKVLIEAGKPVLKES
jgi:MFS transporter, DHA3 family, macrolide efflux protein